MSSELTAALWGAAAAGVLALAVSLLGDKYRRDAEFARRQQSLKAALAAELLSIRMALAKEAQAAFGNALARIYKLEPGPQHFDTPIYRAYASALGDLDDTTQIARLVRFYASLEQLPALRDASTLLGPGGPGDLDKYYDALIARWILCRRIEADLGEPGSTPIDVQGESVLEEMERGFRESMKPEDREVIWS